MRFWKEVQQLVLLLIGCVVVAGCYAPKASQYRPLTQGDLPEVIIPEIRTLPFRCPTEHLEEFLVIANSELPSEEHLIFLYDFPVADPTPTPTPHLSGLQISKIRPIGGNVHEVMLTDAIRLICEIAGIDVMYNPTTRTLLFTTETITPEPGPDPNDPFSR